MNWRRDHKSTLNGPYHFNDEGTHVVFRMRCGKSNGWRWCVVQDEPEIEDIASSYWIRNAVKGDDGLVLSFATLREAKAYCESSR